MKNNDTEKLKGYSLKEYVLSVGGGKEESIGGGKIRINPCPICKHKEHFTIYEDTNTYSSFNECCKGGDIMNFQQEYFKQDFKEAIKALKSRFNIQGDYIPIQSKKQPENSPQQPEKQEQKPQPKHDYSSLIEKWSNDADKTDYFKKRGLTTETIKRFKLGYSESGGQYGKVFKYMIPVTNSYIIYREEGDTQGRYRNAGSPEFLNAEHIANKEARTIFIVEGAFDCMSIEQQGFNAIALNSTSNINKLVEALKEYKQEQTGKQYIFIPDNDSGGQKIIKQIQESFNELNISLFVEQLPEGSGKDCNDYLLKNEKELKSFLEVATDKAEDSRPHQLEQTKEEYLKNNTANHLQAFMNGIKESVNTPSIPTGFNDLDIKLDGGLYEGLYILGAISSLGKSTFILQIADQIAQQGQDVLFFSLEMARSELMAKSISRNTFILCDNHKDAKTTRGITAGKKHLAYSPKENELIKKSIQAYSEYAGKIYISEGLGTIGVEQIKETVKKHIEFTGNKPVIFIDYLQILAPYDMRATDKQNTDKAVMELKRISRDYKIPVIGISSFNRENYSNSVSMVSFKESGAIEYSSDVLMGLQFKRQGELDEINRAKSKNEPKIIINVDEEKRKDPREVELKILKNRNGATGDSMFYNYYPLFNFFEEMDEGKEVFNISY